jgi:hypothetical protein
MLASAHRTALGASEQRGTASEAHQVGRLDLDVALGDRELHALVLPDRSAEHHALLGVGADPCRRTSSRHRCTRRDQRALGVQAIQDVPEAPAFGADEILGGDSRFSKNSSLVSWLTMFGIGRTVMPLCSRRAGRPGRSTGLSVFFCTSARGVVRASRIIQSLCWMREIQTFWPLTT